MGFFGNAVKGLGRAVGRGIEKVGKLVGSEKISQVGRNIQNACAEKVSREGSYSKQEANIHTTERMNEILTSFSTGYFDSATSIEEQCIQKVEIFYDNIISMLEDSLENGVTEVNIRRIKNAKNRIRKTISGAIKEPLSKRMSLDDSECLAILKLDAGEQKKIEMSRFANKVINEALGNLSKKVRESLNEQLDDLKDYLEGLQEEQEKTYCHLKKVFDNLTKDSENQEFNREQEMINSMYIIEVTENILHLLC